MLSKDGIAIIFSDCVVQPSVYSSLDKAIASVKEEYRLHGSEDLFDSKNVEEELRNDLYNTDGCNRYLIECCKVW